ncbi:MAG: PilZ domain-containing protein, partial [Sphingopyxis sp.]|nr:PilZ domain-containing protein [Sphingopyxis sp.]
MVAPMSNPEASASTAPDEKRQPRQSRLVKGSLGCQRLGRFDITIRNVSETGLGGQGPHILNIGEGMTGFLPGHGPK